MSTPLAETIAAAERAVLEHDPHDPAASESRAGVRRLLPALLDEVTPIGPADIDGFCYLAALLDRVTLPEQAIIVLRRAHARAEDGHTRGRARNYEGMLHAGRGRYLEAMAAFERALEDSADDPGLSYAVYANLAALRLALGNLIGSRELAAHAMATRPDEGDHTDADLQLHHTRCQLAILAEQPEEAAVCLADLVRSADRLVERYGGDHPVSIATMADVSYAKFELARIAGDADDMRKALSVLQIAALRLSSMLGADHPRVIGVNLRHASAELELGARERNAGVCRRAVRLAEAAVTQARLVFGAGHPQTLEALCQLGLGHLRLGRLEESPERLQQACDRLTEAAESAGALVHGDHPAMMVAVSALAIAQFELARAEASAELAGQVSEAGVAAELAGGEMSAGPVSEAGVAAELAPDETPAEWAPGETPAERAPGETPAEQASEAGEAAGRAPGEVPAEGARGEASAERVRQAEESLQRALAEATRVFGAGHTTTVQVGQALAACRAFLAAIDGPGGGGSGTVMAPPAVQETESLFKEGEILAAVVVRVDRDEVVVDVGDGTEGVVTARELSIRPGADPAAEVAPGDQLELMVLPKRDREGRLLLSRRRAQSERAWDTIEKTKQEGGVVRGEVIEVVKGGVVRGEVIEVVKGGLILDIGVRGFVPASLVELRRVRDLQRYLGRQLEAKIIETDRRRNNVVLSRRAFLEQAQTEVRGEFLHRLRKGQIRKGVVSSVVAFGAFVDLGGVDGLVHISELSWRDITHPSEAVQVGMEVEVEVLDVDLSRERISLSLKATQEDPWRQFARTHTISEIVPGTVTRLQPFGAFVRVEDGIEGLVHVSELADRHVDLPEQVVHVGQAVMVKIIDIDLQRRRISLSLKQADASFVEGEENFDPTLYGMEATYDEQGNYVYPEGFDPEAGEWLAGYEAQRDRWEREYAEARSRWEAHTRQVQSSHAPSDAPAADLNEGREGLGRE